MIEKRKPHPPSQKEKSFSLGIFGTHTTGFKCLRLKKPFSFLQQTRLLLFSEIRS